MPSTNEGIFCFGYDSKLFNTPPHLNLFPLIIHNKTTIHFISKTNKKNLQNQYDFADFFILPIQQYDKLTLCQHF